MSQWTHIAGIIRFDSLRGLVNEDMKVHDFGRVVSYNDENKKTILPCGSEGSVEITLWENPNLHSLSAYTLSIFGDLRDYDSDENVLKYLKKITKGRIIRQGIVEVNVEYQAIKVFQYNLDLQKWETT